MYENGLIIKTRKLSSREVKKKLRDFIDEISDGCGPEVEQMADELKDYGDQFVDALSGNGNYRNGGGMYRENSGASNGSGPLANGGYNRGGSMFRQHGRGWNRDEGMQHEEMRKQHEQKLQELEKQVQEMRQQMQQY